MTQLNTLEIPDDLYIQIQGLALSASRSVNEQIVKLLQQALASEALCQTQATLLQEIHQSRWKPSQTVPDSVSLLREIRGYDE
jgi:hypothetical protein